MYRRTLISLSLAAAAAWSAGGAASGAVVEGRVVDAGGNPVAEVQLSTMWRWTEDLPIAMGDIAVDEDGKFKFEAGDRGRPQFLLAYAEDGDLAGAATVNPEQEERVIITLGPSVQVRGRFICSDLGGDAGEFTAYWRCGGHQAAMSSSENGEVNLKLPPGEWAYRIYGSDVKRSDGTIALDPAKRIHDMGEVDLPGSFIAMNRGLTVEDWTVTDTRGVAKDAAQVRNFKGKWLLVEFWGYW
ncbi:MAG: hypothetical protein JSV91_09295 [Phycisphaerales bacterium]|nr:MAG: hypothetical protein JSV91_09295 [Phycisphaerales bacterium]